MPRRRSFGSVYKRKRPDGSLMDGWYIRWSDTTGRRRNRFGGLTKTAAEAMLLDVRRRLLRQRLLGEPAIEEVTLSEWLKRIPRLLRARGNTESTISGRKPPIRRLEERLGKRRVVSIRRGDIQAHFDALALSGKMKNSTLHTERSVLSLIFSLAVEARVALQNPVNGVRVGRIVERVVTWLRTDELLEVYTAMPPSIRACVILQSEMGLRPGEARALAWGDFLPGLTVVNVTRALPGAETTKSGRSRRIPTTALARQVLGVLGARRDGRRVGDVEPLFPDIRRADYSHIFRAAADGMGRTKLVPHDLRHNWIAHLVRTPGVDLESARRLAGHRSIVTTQKYLRAIPDDEAFDAMRARDEMQGDDHDELLSAV